MNTQTQTLPNSTVKVVAGVVSFLAGVLLTFTAFSVAAWSPVIEEEPLNKSTTYTGGAFNN